ncbi:hypothetical protein T440DRAFT_483172 [Plenodomus tracheiphilus IPT5]|uniref:Uncharacterized protein n=1 Tax=Plenodomus tracheiphilus IPT5 TaxID=1408161 RepID=A0A6A7ARA8_9PLEO|nr:hypothetical protein T440DRAFT_483172 [Plenodomus tracheiphilus IPT5]
MPGETFVLATLTSETNDLVVKEAIRSSALVDCATAPSINPNSYALAIVAAQQDSDRYSTVCQTAKHTHTLGGASFAVLGRPTKSLCASKHGSPYPTRDMRFHTTTIPTMTIPISPPTEIACAYYNRMPWSSVSNQPPHTLAKHTEKLHYASLNAANFADLSTA